MHVLNYFITFDSFFDHFRIVIDHIDIVAANALVDNIIDTLNIC